MDRLIKTLTCERGELYVTSAGRRFLLANFKGRIEIFENMRLVPRLGTLQKGTKKIYASIMICGNLEYQREVDDDFIDSGKVFDAVADVEGEKIIFSGMTFEDSDPIENELIFNITDLELIQKLLML